MIKIEADMRPLADAMYMSKHVAKKFDSDANLDNLSTLMAESASLSFNNFMDIQAAANPDRLGHMYEQGKIGDEAGRLWKMIIAGSPRVKLLTFDYKQSRKHVPAGQAQTGIAGDTRTGGHVFRWKAPVIENGIKVNISPMGDNYLAIPSRESGKRGTNNAGTMWFTKSTVSPRVDQFAKGAFTEEWIKHFSTVAIEVVSRVVSDFVENWFYSDVNRMYRRIEAAKPSPVPAVPRLNIRVRASARRIADETYREYEARAEALAATTRANRIGDNLSD